MASSSKLQTPLNWNVPIVDDHGRPSNEFMQKWADMLAINRTIPTSVTTPAQVSAILDLLGDVQNDVLMRGAALWAAVTATAVLDTLGSTQGDLLVRGSSNWSVLHDPADTTKFLNGAHPPVWGNVHDSDLTLSNITTNDVSISAHGFAPKAPNDATKFLNGVGGYTVPASGGGGSSLCWPSGIVPGSSADTTTHATVAHRIPVAQACSVDKVFAVLNPSGTGGTYRCFIGKATGVSFDISSIVGTATNTVTIAATGPQTVEFDFATAVTLTAGQYYFFCIVLTSGSTTTATRIQETGTTLFYPGFPFDYSVAANQAVYYNNNTVTPTLPLAANSNVAGTFFIGLHAQV